LKPAIHELDHLVVDAVEIPKRDAELVAARQVAPREPLLRPEDVAKRRHDPGERARAAVGHSGERPL
jgi:hypothetical protein